MVRPSPSPRGRSPRLRNHLYPLQPCKSLRRKFPGRPQLQHRGLRHPKLPLLRNNAPARHNPKPPVRHPRKHRQRLQTWPDPQRPNRYRQNLSLSRYRHRAHRRRLRALPQFPRLRKFRLPSLRSQSHSLRGRNRNLRPNRNRNLLNSTTQNGCCCRKPKWYWVTVPRS